MAISFVAEAHGTANYTTSISVSKPTGTVDGDVMIAFCGGTPSTPAGWTLLGSADSGSNSLRTVRVFRKVASSEGSSYTFSIQSSIACAVIATYRGVNNTTPVDTAHFDISPIGATTNFNTASVTAVTTQWGLSFAMGYEYGSSSTRTWTEGSGTERSDFSVSNSSSPDNCNCLTVDSAGTLSAGSFSRTQTRSSAASDGASAVVLLNVAGGGIVSPAAPLVGDPTVTANDAAVAYGIGPSAGKASVTGSAKTPATLYGQLAKPGCAAVTVSCKDIGRLAHPATVTAAIEVKVAHIYYGAPSYRTYRVPPDEPLNPGPR